MGKGAEFEFLEVTLLKIPKIMKIKFNFDMKKFEKEVLKEAKNIKFELNCPKCKLYC